MAKIALLTLIVAVMAGIVFLAVSPAPAPTRAVEKPIAVDQFWKK
jgi:hypothetical protein